MARVAILHYSRLNTRVSYVEQILSIKITFIPFAQLPVNLLGSLCPLIMHTVKSSNAFAENSISAASSSYLYTYTHMIRRVSLLSPILREIAFVSFMCPLFRKLFCTLVWKYSPPAEVRYSKIIRALCTINFFFRKSVFPFSGSETEK